MLDLLKLGLTGQSLPTEQFLRQHLVVPESVTTTQVMEHFRRARSQFALIVDEYGRIPAAADRFEVAGLRFEVVDMDRNRIDKLIVAHAPKSD